MSFTARELKERYEAGENIISLLRGDESTNSEEMIEVSYDLQSGSYVERMADPESAAFREQLGAAIAGIFSELNTAYSSVLEAGIGEATTLAEVCQHLSKDVSVYGFDLSWSRVAYAKEWLKARGVSGGNLATGSLLKIPMPTSSVDIVFTSHAVEPNGGKEVEILEELHRVAKKFVVLMEPSYELATDEGKARMTKHGYCRGLKEKAENLGFKVIEYRLFEHIRRPHNPTALMIIEKLDDSAGEAQWACPMSGMPLDQLEGGWLRCRESLKLYPSLEGIPCLLPKHGVLASHFGLVPSLEG